MSTVHFILNDPDLSGFYKFCNEKIGIDSYQDVDNPQLIKDFSYDKVQKLIKDRSKYLLFKNCKFESDSFTSVTEAKEFIDKIKRQNNGFGDIFLHFKDISNDISHKQFSAFVSKFNSDRDENGRNKATSGTTFYNFGNTYIANKTFFNSGYSVFGENIAHEAINCFATDNNERYFYLCDDGKIRNYNNPFINNYRNFPPNYIDWEKAELINFSKYDSAENNSNNYAILQRVTKIEPCETAFQDNRNNDDYKDINYGDKNICDIFRLNEFVRRNPRTGVEIHADENYPFVTFKASEENVFVPSEIIPVFCPNGDEKFRNFISSSLKQYSIFEGTKLYDAFHDIIGGDEKWKIEKPKTVSEYIKSDNYKNDIEEDYLLKIINRDQKETFFSRIIEYLFANSKELLSRFFYKVYGSETEVDTVTGVYNEEKNMDIMFTFKDENKKEHIVVIENKLFASFNDNQQKELENIFNITDKNKEKKNGLAEAVNKVKNNYEEYCTVKNKEPNQLTKYYNIASVLYLNMTGEDNIDVEKMHFVILAPEFRVNELEGKKDNYYYGECYDVVSYQSLKEVLDEVISEGLYDNNDALKGIAVQFSRAIRQYASDNCTYYQRKMISRFAKAVKDNT